MLDHARGISDEPRNMATLFLRPVRGDNSKEVGSEFEVSRFGQQCGRVKDEGYQGIPLRKRVEGIKTAVVMRQAYPPFQYRTKEEGGKEGARR